MRYAISLFIAAAMGLLIGLSLTYAGLGLFVTEQGLTYNMSITIIGAGAILGMLIAMVITYLSQNDGKPDASYGA